MFLNKKKIKDLSIESAELEPETIDGPDTQERKNLKFLLSLERFYERLLFLARLFFVFGIAFGLLCLVFLFICWRLSVLCFGLALWCLWYARNKKSLADCAPSFIRFIMISDAEIRKAQEDPSYKIQLPKSEDFI